MTYLQLFIVLSLPVTGICYATLGSIKLPLSRRLGLDEAKVGGLISSFGFMVGPAILLAGVFSDTYGRRPVWMLGSLLVVVSFLIFAAAKRYGTAVLATVMLAAGWAGMINVANPLMGEAFANQFAGTNLGDALFGGGAFLCPLLVEYLRRKLGFGPGLTVIAAIAFIPFAMGYALDFRGVTQGGKLGEAFAAFKHLLNDRTVWLLGLTLMCWIVIESGTAGWATTLVKESRRSDVPNKAATNPSDGSASRDSYDPQHDSTGEAGDRTAARALSAFWLCFMGSRILAAVLAHRPGIDKAELITITQWLQVGIGVLSVLTMVGLAFLRARPMVIALVIFAGFIFGPFFPNLIGQLLIHLETVHKSAFAGRAVGMLFACASVSWCILPTIMGFIGRKRGVRTAFLLPAAIGVVMIVLILVNKIHV